MQQEIVEDNSDWQKQDDDDKASWDYHFNQLVYDEIIDNKNSFSKSLKNYFWEGIEDDSPEGFEEIESINYLKGFENEMR
jgi:hypothetical protein